MLRLFSMSLVAAVVIGSSAFADIVETPRTAGESYLYGMFFLHSESRLGVDDISRVREQNLDLAIGYDRLVNPDTNIYVGARLGLIREQVLTSVPVGPAQTRPFVGGQVFRVFPIREALFFKAGAAADLILVPNGPSSPAWLYAAGIASLRWHVSEGLYAEIPAEIGFTPFFDGTPIITRLGLQLGFSI